MKQSSRTMTPRNAGRRWVCFAAAIAFLLAPGTGSPAETRPPDPGGELRILSPKGEELGACPLQHTDVEADVAGFVGRVRVRQRFHNPLDRKIEAVYVFPLPHGAAVNEMTMEVGDRRVVGRIKPRDEARRIYGAARKAGHVTSLLDQERPNIFTQSVANIEPGAEVVIEIAYVETLAYENGTFEFVFPTVVGPRYMPGRPAGRRGTGWSPDTSRVPDASRISPPVALPGTRAGHDISVTVHIDAGTEIFDIDSSSHAIDVERAGNQRATITLAERAEIPNKDFILRYRTAADEIRDAFLVHEDARGRYFTLILQPPRRVAAAEAAPKEMIFVIDRSGSMSGFPIAKAKEVMRRVIESMNPRDTFNLLSFAGGTGRCFDKPVRNTPGNRAVALRYLADLYGSGGTEMMAAIRAALEGPVEPGRLRVVAFMTDGYIGNDFEIIDAVKKNAGTARVFAFGIGNGVNRFLLDGMAQAGRGEVEFVTLESEADAAVERFAERIHSPVLTDIEIDWGELAVADVYPKRFPDLFSAKPLMIHGRLTAASPGTVTLRGRTVAGLFERRIDVTPSASAERHEAIPALWARAAVADLMMRDYAALQRGDLPQEIRHEITTLGIVFHLVTQFTSFVAVEEMSVTVGGEPTTVAVPVEIPDGVSYRGVFGESGSVGVAAQAFAPGRGVVNSFRSAPVLRALSLVDKASERLDEAREEDRRKASTPDGKLAAELRGLADKVSRASQDGNLTVGRVRVVGHRVDVMLYLSEIYPEMRTALEKLGFVKKAESKTARVLIGTIDVRKLGELAKLDGVVHVAPVPTPRRASGSR